MVRGSRTDLKEVFGMKKSEIIRPTVRKAYWNKRCDTERFPNLSVCLRGLCGEIKQGLGIFPSPPHHCPAAEAGAELTVAVRDEQSHISVKWLKMWLFLAICPQKVSVPIREAGQSCGPRHHLHCPNTLCFSYLSESMLQLKTPGCNCSL